MSSRVLHGAAAILAFRDQLLYLACYACFGSLLDSRKDSWQSVQDDYSNLEETAFQQASLRSHRTVIRALRAKEFLFRRIGCLRGRQILSLERRPSLRPIHCSNTNLD